jgi:nucleoside-diphosphate-sugar epimerase
MCAQRYAKSRIIAFSTGNVYGLAPVVHGGSTETSRIEPLGDYAMSCLGRERMFDHFSRIHHTPVATIRLYYATELRYGVLFDMASKVWRGEPIDVSMGMFNAIWQGDANAMSLAALEHASSPPMILNVAGPELLSMRTVCETFGQMMNKPPTLLGAEAADALIGNGQLAHRLFGYPTVPIGTLMQWIADWVMSGGTSLGKPTHFETRDGKY